MKLILFCSNVLLWANAGCCYVLQIAHSFENCITVLQHIVYNEKFTGTELPEELVLLSRRKSDGSTNYLLWK